MFSFVFLILLSFAAVMSSNTTKPIYFFKIVQKNVVKENLEADLDIKCSQENNI